MKLLIVVIRFFKDLVSVQTAQAIRSKKLLSIRTALVIHLKKKCHPFELLRLSVLGKLSSVRKAQVIHSKKLPLLERLWLSILKRSVICSNYSGYPFWKNCHPFKQLGLSIGKNCHPFKQLG